MSKRATVHSVLVFLVGVVCAAAVCESRAWAQRRRHEKMLRELQEGHEHEVGYVASWLAENQSRIGKATYLVKGLPIADETILGYPVCNLGCIIAGHAEMEFIRAYNEKLEELAGKPGDRVAQPQRATGVADHGDGHSQ